VALAHRALLLFTARKQNGVKDEKGLKKSRGGGKKSEGVSVEAWVLFKKRRPNKEKKKTNCQQRELTRRGKTGATMVWRKALKARKKKRAEGRRSGWKIWLRGGRGK